MKLSNLKNISSTSETSSLVEDNIPKASKVIFNQGIRHPDLYLWDVWSAREGSDIHLYCLAIGRLDETGDLLSPQQRNLKPFHVRHFVSIDEGDSWQDHGCYQKARFDKDLFDSKSIWSGSILSLDDGRQLTAYTGIRRQTKSLSFQQSLGLSISLDWQTIQPDSQQVISDPFTDFDSIVEKGYFLGERELLGHEDGEEGGPILAWRDPFLYRHANQLHVFWSAKMGCRTPALGHALLKETESGFVMDKLYRPVTMPDGNEYTQLELPKVMYDDLNQRFLLLIASCNRLDERQSDKEADKRVRLYMSESLDGPWSTFGHDGSTLTLAEQNMFGITVVSVDFKAQKLDYVAPYTEEAGAEKFLTLSKTYSLDIGALGEKHINGLAG